MKSVHAELVDAVTALVAVGGVRAADMADIEEATGHGPEVVDAEFGSHRALIVATASELAATTILSDPDPGSLPPSIEGLTAELIDGYRRYVDSEPTRFAALLQFSSGGIFGDRELLAPLIEQTRRHRMAVRAHLAALHRTGLTGVATADLSLIARTFVETSHGIELCHLLEGNAIDRTAAYAHLATTLAARLANDHPVRGNAAGIPEQRPDDYARDYRLNFVLEPDGVVRDVLAAEGIRPWNARTFLGRRIEDVAAQGPLGPSRGAVWVERLAHARQHPGRTRYDDAQTIGDAPEPRHVVTTITPIHNVRGELESILADVEDRSTRVAAQARAVWQREQLRNALELTRLGTYIVYFREPLIIANERFGEIYGRDPQELMETEGIEGFLQIIHSEDREGVRDALTAAMEERVDYVANYRLWAERPGGPELRWIQGLGRVEHDEHGPLRVLGVVEDVTERHKQQEALLRSQKREAIGTLAAGIAHDFNNVLGAILGNASAAERQISAGEVAGGSIQEIAAGARRAGELVERLLSFSRNDQAPRERYLPTDIVREACALVRPTLGIGLTLREKIALGVRSTIGDPTGLHQAILNLVVNAEYALGDNHGRIDVIVDQVELATPPTGGAATMRAGDYVRIRVRDNGPGLTGDVADRAFDPFFTTKPVHDAAGLGLASAQALIHNQGGTIELDSTPGEGTTFTIHLPAIRRGAFEGSEALAPRSRPQGASPPRVLFVDDERSLTDLAAREMPANGCVVVTANDPAAALELLRSDPDGFDAVITDLAMPQMNGLRFARGVRAVRPTIPIVLTSGFITSEAQAEARRIGIGRMVPKPCTIDELADAVLDLVDERPATESAQV